MVPSRDGAHVTSSQKRPPPIKVAVGTKDIDFFNPDEKSLRLANVDFGISIESDDRSINKQVTYFIRRNPNKRHANEGKVGLRINVRLMK